ncbi:hypothetical protein [Flaviaesturariibacter amylovorans]|uniref:Uncharacterized protein n=1 Tax=Flaviaesturariibacter amylovorans TaxID=1084520 RepID=A0ABP8HEI3_9BACT
MRLRVLLSLFCLLSVFAACFPSWEPRSVDGQQEWAENGSRLKSLAAAVRADTVRYRPGMHSFPDGFGYPFDEGFHVARHFYATPMVQPGDTTAVTLTFYLDRGIGEHYSAIVFTLDQGKRSELDENVRNGGNDFLLEPNWYLVND